MFLLLSKSFFSFCFLPIFVFNAQRSGRSNMHKDSDQFTETKFVMVQKMHYRQRNWQVASEQSKLGVGGAGLLWGEGINCAVQPTRESLAMKLRQFCK